MITIISLSIYIAIPIIFFIGIMIDDVLDERPLPWQEKDE